MRRVANQKKPENTALNLDNTKGPLALLKKIWHFLWYEDSIWSWLANIILAFILIKFIVYPALSAMLGTNLPVVAVVSGSMEHKIAPVCERYMANGLCASYSSNSFDMCGTSYSQGGSVNLTTYWQTCGAWYDHRNISMQQFATYSFTNGFNTGDVMVVRGKSWNDLGVGDVIVWVAADGTPIIHRIVTITQTGAMRTVGTKGDHNVDQITVGLRTETQIKQSQYIGVATLRIPYVGYVKLWAARAIGALFG